MTTPETRRPPASLGRHVVRLANHDRVFVRMMLDVAEYREGLRRAMRSIEAAVRPSVLAVMGLAEEYQKAERETARILRRRST